PIFVKQSDIKSRHFAACRILLVATDVTPEFRGQRTIKPDSLVRHRQINSRGFLITLDEIKCSSGGQVKKGGVHHPGFEISRILPSELQFCDCLTLPDGQSAEISPARAEVKELLLSCTVLIVEIDTNCRTAISDGSHILIRWELVLVPCNLPRCVFNPFIIF